MVDKVIVTDILDQRTTGQGGAKLINDLKRAVNQLVEAVNSLEDAPYGSAAERDVGTASNEVPLNSDLGTASTKDVGTGGNQIPTNDNLGTAAYESTGTGDDEIPTNSQVKALIPTYQSELGKAGRYVGYSYKALWNYSSGTFTGFAANTLAGIQLAGFGEDGQYAFVFDQSGANFNVYELPVYNDFSSISSATLLATSDISTDVGAATVKGFVNYHQDGLVSRFIFLLSDARILTYTVSTAFWNFSDDFLSSPDVTTLSGGNLPSGVLKAIDISDDGEHMFVASADQVKSFELTSEGQPSTLSKVSTATIPGGDVGAFSLVEINDTTKMFYIEKSNELQRYFFIDPVAMKADDTVLISENIDLDFQATGQIVVDSKGYSVHSSRGSPNIINSHTHAQVVPFNAAP